MRALQQLATAAALAARSSVSEARIGIVSSYDPSHYAIKARVQPEDTETGWMPIGTSWMGSGWGIVCPPSIGDQVLLVPLEGAPEAWVMVQRFYSDEDRPPESAPSGVFLARHQSGTLLRFLNDGSVDLVTAADLRATVGGNATVMVAGNVAATVEGMTMLTSVGTTTITTPVLDIIGNVAITGNLTTTGGTIGMTGDVTITGATHHLGTVDANGHRIDDTHEHSNVQSGSSNSGPPL